MRKRKVVDIFDRTFEFANLVRSFKKASTGRRSYLSVLMFQSHLEENIFLLQEQVKKEEFSFGPYKSFYVREPKLRLIESAPFRDRIIHHAVFDCLESIYDAKFYEYSFACRSGRGTHAAMLTLQDWVKASKKTVFLKCDVKKYFPSVDREILLEILRRDIADERFFRLLENLILKAPKTGIPIGNLTSQLFANLYLNELDQFVKRQLRVKHYIRYMDDFIILTDTVEEAKGLRSVIEEFLLTKLKLELSPQKVRIGRLHEGIPFVGYCQRYNDIKVRGASLRRIRKKVRKSYRRQFGRNYDMPEGFWEEATTKRSAFYGTWSSFVGQTKYASNGVYLKETVARHLEMLPP